MNDFDTPLDSGTDDVLPEDDTAPVQDDFDPETQDTEAEAENDATDEGEEPAEPEAPAEAEVLPTAKVKLPDGTTATADELVKGYLRQADYTRKTQEAAKREAALKADASTLESAAEKLAQYVEKLVPPKPGRELAMQNPAEYVRQMAQHEAGMTEIQGILASVEGPKTVQKAATERERQEKLAVENAKLIERIPEASTAEGRQKVMTNVAEAAQAIGLTMDELQGLDDHRVFAALHYAKIGMEAEKSRAKVQAKVAKAAPAAPVKPSAPQNSARVSEALKAFNRAPTPENHARLVVARGY